MVDDTFEATFQVDLRPHAVWQALTARALPAQPDDTRLHYVLPGFPSFVPQPLAGASCTLLEQQPERQLRLRKDHQPCQDTDIVITLEPAGDATRVSLTQSGFGAFLDFAGRDTVFGHGRQMVTDLHLFLERGLTVPGTVWGVNLGARTVQTPIGIEIHALQDGGFAQRAGLVAGDLLLTVRGIRIHDIQQLFTVLALIDPGANTPLTWARGRQARAGSAVPAG